MGDKRPSLTAFSQNFLGGVQTFYYNLLSHPPDDYFNIEWLLLDIKGHTFVRPPAPFGLGEVILEYNDAIGRWRNAKKLSNRITDKEGLVLTNHIFELDALMLYPKANTVVFHLVHDHGYLGYSKGYADIIDVFVTHNYELYEELLKDLPGRKSNIFYLPYGIKLSTTTRKRNLNGKLKIAFMGRICTDKGVFDMPVMDDRLKVMGIEIDWLIIGNGPEIKEFKAIIDSRANFTHKVFETTEEIFQAIATCDIYLLPSVLDGTPVSLLESMSVGLVPILYRFNNGIQRVVTDDIGYITEIGEIDKVVSIVSNLNANRLILEEKSLAAINSARANFDAKLRAKDYFTLFKRYTEFKRDKSALKSPKPNVLNNPLVPYKLADFYLKSKERLFNK